MNNFRFDINGLRAIAVIAVVLFHFNPTLVPGGFAGVDVFFVISGFLMTGIIFRGLKNNSFNVLKFYAARANRIIPALAVLCGVVLLFSYFFIGVLDQIDVHRHVNGSMWFFSNFIYWRESGYFDTDAHEKWLLHTWSLSVEWQFYILYPAALLALRRFFSLENLKRFVVVGAVLSFAISIIITMKFPNIAYYSLPTRAWEMMLGGLAFLYPFHTSERISKTAEISGLLLILGSYAFVSSDTPWPGYGALFPVLGAYLLIISNQQSSFITNNIAFQYIGKWSYSIYLWHWPIVVFGFYFSIENWYMLGIPLSVCMGFISYQFIEKKHVLSINNFVDILKFKPFIYTFLILSISYVLSMFNGLNSLPSDYKLTKQQFRDKYEGHLGLYGKGKEPVYINSDENNLEIILIGDSYARHYYSFFKNSGMKVASLAVDGCYSSRDFFNKNNDMCEFRYRDEIEFIKKHKDKVVVISRNWTDLGTSKIFNRASQDKVSIDSQVLIEQLSDLIDIAHQAGSKVYIVGNSQGADVVPFKAMAEQLLYGKTVTDIKEPKKDNVMGSVLRENSESLNYEFLDVASSLCEKDSCFTVKDGQPVYTDKGHFSKVGADIVGSHIFNKLMN